MVRVVSSVVVFALVVFGGGLALAAPQDSWAPVAASGSRAAVRLGASRARDAAQTLSPPPRRSSRSHRHPRRAVLIGAAIGAAVGGTLVAVQYREGGAEAAWAGIYPGALAGGLIGWRVSR